MFPHVLNILLIYLIIFQESVESTEDPKLLSLLCQSNSETCSDCLNAHPNCVWCYDLVFKNERCDIVDKLNERECSHIYEGKKSEMNILSNLDFKDVSEEVETAVQIRPQKVKMQLRPGDSKTVKLKYKISKNYPLDLYYLMDASYSMKDDLETVATLGDELSHLMHNITKHFQIGLGTFSDKVLMPFAYMDKIRFENPCLETEEKNCSPAFDFRHQVKLNKRVQNFIEKIKETTVTANLDNAEGAFDALMQVIVCGEKIGWRKDARKLILLLTNGMLHFSGDGKLAGISKKADGLCHLDDKGSYTEANTQDYPSLEEIYRKIKKHKVNIIFAVTEEVYNYYYKLNEVIPNFSYVTQLHSDSSNILSVVKKGYEDAVSVVEFQDNSQDPIEINYYSRCNKEHSELNHTSSCFGVKEGEKYEFIVNIQLKSCPENPKLWQQTIVIDETHLEKESLEIEVEMLCGCNCDDMKQNDTRCSHHGDFECSICKCNNGWSGENCNCDVSNVENSRELENNCREISNNRTSPMCNGNGECICGKCDCNSMYTGKFCQYRHCDRINGQECGGPTRGLCSQGECLCMPDYTGPNCLCPLDKTICIAPGDKDECSGRGFCNCGKCQCNSEPFTFSGNYCEKCSTCSGLCHLYNKCVKCSIQNTCISDECDPDIINSVQFVDNIDDSPNACVVQVDKAHCPYWKFSYDINKNNTVQVKILNEACTPPLSANFYAAGAFIITILVGLLSIIVVKIRNKRADAREYAKHLKEIENAKYESSALYVDPNIKSMMPKGLTFEE